MKRAIVITIFAFVLSLLSNEQVALAEEMPSIQEEIIYDILIDRYNNGRQMPSDQVDVNNPMTYNGGDLKGITMYVDVIEEHGFTTISISPPMQNAPRGYHGYWIEDFYEIEEEFGTEEDLKELIEEAHSRNMKVFIEFVTNYAAKSSPLVTENESWFKEVEASPVEATKWLENVKQFDHEQEEVQQYLLDVAYYWMDEFNIDGFKLHAADQMSPQFLHTFTEKIKEKDPYFYFIATSLQGDSLEHLCDQEHIDAIANERLFEELNEVLSKPDEPISKLYDRWEETTCEKDLLFVDNLNTARFSNNVADEGRYAVNTWMLALTYLYLTPGSPIIFQGSEVPMYGPSFKESQYMVDSISADQDLKKLYERLSSLREEFTPFVKGDFKQVATNEGLSLFSRTYEDQTIYFGINNDSRSRKVKISGVPEGMLLRGLMHDDTVRADENDEFTLSIERETTEVYIIQPDAGINWPFVSFVIGVIGLFVLFIIIMSMRQRKREQQH